MLVMKRLLHDKGAVLALVIILGYVLLGVLAPLVTWYDPNHIDTAHKYASISWQHLLGTDHLGRDILTRLIYAIVTKLVVCLCGTDLFCCYWCCAWILLLAISEDISMRLSCAYAMLCWHFQAML